MDSDVLALAVYDGRLIAGGSFTTAGDVAASRVAAWDGSSWSALGEGVDDRVWALLVYDGNLIAAGEFTTAGGDPANRVASWNGDNWSSLGSGVNRRVWSLAAYDNKLILGGEFTFAGSEVSGRLAQWTKKDPTDVVDDGGGLLPESWGLAQNYPNPFNPTTTIAFDLPRRSRVSIAVFNLLGQKVAELADGEYSAGHHVVTWDGVTSGGQRAGSGVYFYRLVAGDHVESRKMVLLK
jgi:hypothetical protein